MVATVRPVPSAPEALFDIYRRSEDTLNIVYGGRHVSYVSPTNFGDAASAPRHRWFSYKEGFSPQFVDDFLSKHIDVSRSIVLDPFAGVGTTVLQSALNGGAGHGFDVSPLAHFVSTTKGIDLDRDNISMTFDNIRSMRTRLPDIATDDLLNKTVRRYFEPEVLDVLLRIRSYIRTLDGPEQSLLKLALLETLEEFSTHRKAGNGVKKKSPNRYSPFGNSAMELIINRFERSIGMMLEDIQSHPIGQSHKFVLGSALEIDNLLPPASVDAVLTSPPYANCFDYSKIYMRELWLGDFFTSRADQSSFRADSIRSHVHARWPSRYDGYGSPTVENLIAPHLSKQTMWSQAIPSMLVGYFRDLGRLLVGLRKVVKSGGRIGFVVGNSIYGGVPVASDLILAEMAQLAGMSIESIHIVRHIVPSSQQYALVGDSEYSRESVVTLVA